MTDALHYGLHIEDREAICNVFSQIQSIDKAVLYGSRALGTYRDGSDIDLTFFGDALTQDTLGDIADALDDLLLPYQFDLSIYSELNHAELQAHIDRVGKVFYERNGKNKPNPAPSRQPTSGGDGVRWETVKLGDVCEIYQPKTISKREMLVDGTYPVFGANGIIGKYDKFNHAEPEVLITCRGATCGSVNISEPNSWINGNAMVIKPSKDCIDKKYIEYFARGAIDYSQVITGAAQPQITRKTLSPVRFSYPPLEEQKQIVALLDEAFAGIDAAIAHTEQNIQNARALFESHLNAVFTQKGDGWVDLELGDICDFQNGFAFKSADTVETSNVQLVRMGNLYQNKLNLDRKPSFYPESFSTVYERYELYAGDLIISLTGTVNKKDYGYTVVIPETKKTLLLNQRIAKFVNLSPLISKGFLLYLLRSKVFLEQLYSSASGTRQANLSTNKMKSMHVALPAVSMQKKVTEKLNVAKHQSQQLEKLYTQKRAALQELKQSLLHKAFAGELTQHRQEAA